MQFHTFSRFEVDFGLDLGLNIGLGLKLEGLKLRLESGM
jgi:hypothetical protein